MVMVSDALDSKLHRAYVQMPRDLRPERWHDIARLKRPHAPLDGREVETWDRRDPKISKKIAIRHMELVASIGQHDGLSPCSEARPLKRNRGPGKLL